MPPAPWIVTSQLSGIEWPGLPADEAARLLALQYQLDRSQWWSAENLQAQQMRQFNAVFSHALATVPYYRERCAQWSSVSIDWNRYRELPVSTRSTVQQAGVALHSESPPPAHGPLTSTESSGSTGTPLVTRGTAWTQLFWQALLLREHDWHGRDLRGKLAAIRSKTGEQRFPGWGAATAAFATGPSVMRGLSDDLDNQLQWLQQEDPDYVISYATNIQMLARRSRELGLRLPRLKQARSYGETLRPDVRDDVRGAWSVELVDSYSSEELGYIALQCPECTHYHVQSESLIVEVLDETGGLCRPGEVGRVVVSTLHNFAMPLLRYANGDYAEAGGDCRCGRGLPVLRRIVGRQRNMVVRPDGVRHWPSFPSEAWRGIAPVRQIQLLQDAADHIEVRLVTDRALTAEESARLTVVLQECLGYPFRMTLNRVPAIARNFGQKYEDFVSLLEH